MASSRIQMCFVIFVMLAATLPAQVRDQVIYVDPYDDPAIEELREVNDNLREEAEKKTEQILAAEADAADAREEEQKKLRFDLGHIVKPESPEAFTTHLWHFPPTPQYLTGACWSFSTTSFLESEIKRKTGREIKLSEMWTVYWEFVAKARGFVASRGETNFEHGSQSAALIRVYSEYGVVPRAAYEGVLAEDGRFNQNLMHEQISAFLNWCKDKNFWHEESVINMVRRMLDRTMGRPPEAVRWDGVDLTPREFLSQICQLDPGEYVDVMSTLSVPFWTRGEYRVPDNWWHGAKYVNVPLDVWYGVIRKALASGHTVVIGGDVSEPGLNGFEDVAVIPTFDIPREFIDQSARELRFANGTTTDDHGVHMVGHTAIGISDWFLIKDSNRSSRHGSFEGYYMYRDDYVKLKMLTLMVHRDLIKDILERVSP